MSMTTMLREFHRRFGLEYSGPPRALPRNESAFRVLFLQEELTEYKLAVADKDLEKQLDALVDLVYVAVGTACLQGFDFDEAFRRVHGANMRKVRSPSTVLEGRGSAQDIVKPKGWEPPFLADLVRNPNDN